MARSEVDVLTIGNAIVDVIAKVDDAFVERNGLVKGSMNLIDEARAEELYNSMGPAIEISGGSAIGLPSLSGKYKSASVRKKVVIGEPRMTQYFNCRRSPIA